MRDLLEDARKSLSHRLQFAEVMALLSPKDRASAQRRVDAFSNGGHPHRAEVWQHLTCALMTLAPHAAKFVGKQTVQCYVPDGRYRKQVFALEDPEDGTLCVYCQDVLDDAIKTGLLGPAMTHGDGNGHVIRATGDVLRVEQLDGESVNPGAHFKDLTGWNRKALRITLPPEPTPAQVEGAELLCALAGLRFVKADAPAPLKTEK